MLSLLLALLVFEDALVHALVLGATPPTFDVSFEISTFRRRSNSDWSGSASSGADPGAATGAATAVGASAGATEPSSLGWCETGAGEGEAAEAEAAPAMWKMDRDTCLLILH